MNAHRRFGCAALFVALAMVQIAWGQAGVKSLGEQELVSLLVLGLDDATIVARVKKGGVAFEASEPTLQKLKAAGASEAVLNAVRETGSAKAAPAAPTADAVTYEQVLQMLTLGIEEDGVLKRLAKSPTLFTLDARQVEALKKAGASEKLLAAMAGQRPAPSQAGDISDLAIILDCSGSMRELTTGRETKMTVAKRVVTDLVQKIPEGLNVTFVIYGHEIYGAADDPRNCQAVKVARPLSMLDASGKAELTQMISRLQPTGATPIALSLRTAGQELAKNKALCGLVLITDGLETCHGNPAAEAAALVANLKVTFGVNVVGFGVKPEENAVLQSIADAGKGKYYAAADAKALTDSLGAIAQEIQAKATPPEQVVGTRRAVKVVQPEIELLPMKEILLTEAGAPGGNTLYNYVKAKTSQYGEEIRIPSGTVKYDLFWIPKEGHALRMATELTFPERKVVSIKPEDYLGLIRVKGTGAVKEILALPAGSPGGNTRRNYVTQEAKKFGDLMIVPAGKYDIYVNENLIEEGLEVTPGKLYELE
jgi:hypothetical protein